MHYIRFYSLLFVIGITFFSCSKEDYEAQIPTYISIDQITLTTNLVTEGSASSNIVDAWVFINDDLVGVYELPAKFPVLKEGNATIKIFAGIKNNGASGDRKRYLLYSGHTEQINMVRGETIVINPTVNYASGTIFSWIEDFESASLSFLYTSGSDTVINKQSLDVKEGSFSGLAKLNDDMDFFEATTIGLTNVPRKTTVYLELDFKTNEQVLIGIYLDGTQYPLVTLNTTTIWKKIYIDLETIINDNPAASELKVFIGIKETGSTPFITSSPEIYLDNLKLVHF